MRKRIDQRIRPILEEAKERLQKIYGSRLKGIVLYGSYARGEAVEGSDIDLLVLLDRVANPVRELEKCSRKIHQLDFRYDMVISVVPLGIRQYNIRKSPLILNAKREGIPIL